ncbi:MAG: hypothetical protein KF832_25475 [Caldilineaceae bacterium]|nr:hypothetical protein [Caldilineaceae bacterium]
MQTIITLPPAIRQAIAQRLAEPDARAWMQRAQALHLRYTQPVQDTQQRHVTDALDALAYLGLRASATYAQIWGAMDAVVELMPSWQPQTLLDLGSGPGSGLWALTDCLPTLAQATCLDQNPHFLTLGQQLWGQGAHPLAATWQRGDLLHQLDQTPPADVVLLANVLNELNSEQRTQLVSAAFQRSRDLLLVVEPGTPVGSRIVQSVAQQLAGSGIVVAPYLGNQVVEEAWLHFPQRFTRPDFARRLRQEMRDSALMASDWEEAKYSYVAIARRPPEQMPWARVIGPVHLQKGYLEVPVLTQTQRLQVKVLKRQKPQYPQAKKLRWGEAIYAQRDLMAAE